MPAKGKPEQLVRTATDESLRTERDKTDDELVKRRADLEEDADRVRSRARERTDEVLQSARAKADEELRRTGGGSHEHAVVKQERSQADQALCQERATTDEAPSRDRDARRHALEVLLSLERDQTDQNLLVEREHADEAIGSRDDFLAIVSHDLRNLLGGIAVSAAAIERIPCDDDKLRTAIAGNAQRIQRLTTRMNRLIGDLLDIASIDAGRLAVVPECHDATELLRETLEVFQPIAVANDISLRSDVRAGSPFARYDHERILQVLANLVFNAIKFTPKSGTIDIVLEPLEHAVRFAVRDTGAGIAPDKLNAVFERFWQGARHERSGLGLGLYISRCIVEAHGGKIWVDSRPGEGSTFYFTLPAAPPTATSDVSRT